MSTDSQDAEEQLERVMEIMQSDPIEALRDNVEELKDMRKTCSHDDVEALLTYYINKFETEEVDA
jgi:hypothetical protein